MLDTRLMEARIARGVEFLDQHDPSWWERVSPSALRMQEDSCCILGQAFGSYTKIVLRLFDEQRHPASERFAWTVDHGFTLDAEFETAGGITGVEYAAYQRMRHQEWVQLTEGWRTVLHARQAAAVAIVAPELVPA